MIKRLKELRINLGFSQKQLADVINVSQQSINKYENHNVEPNIDTLISLAKLFSTSIDYLVGVTDIKRPIENTSEYHLNDKEQEFIDLYRKLKEQDKELIHTILKRLI